VSAAAPTTRREELHRRGLLLEWFTAVRLRSLRPTETRFRSLPGSSRIPKVGPGEYYDVVWDARELGQWLLHCYISHHTTTNNTE
jgi:FtsP/CotA-like multicopper oxidase with cupredoxin domain